MTVSDGRLLGATHRGFHDDGRASVAYWLAPEARGAGHDPRGQAARALGVRDVDDLLGT